MNKPEIILIDSREKPAYRANIEQVFTEAGILHPVNKLLVGDYVNYDRQRIVVDRKHGLEEVASNLGPADYDRFHDEMRRAQLYGIKLIVLVENENGIEKLEQVKDWLNPRRYEELENGEIVDRNVLQGEALYKIMAAQQKRYGIKWLFCSPKQTGYAILRMLAPEAAVKYKQRLHK